VAAAARRVQRPESGGSVADWVEFGRSDAGLVIAMVRAVAQAADPGLHGEGVEVVIEAPKPGWFVGLLGDHEPDRARIAVTRAGGEVRYPFHVQLVTDHGGDAAHRVPRVAGWASSNSAGRAYLMCKERPEIGWPEADRGAGSEPAGGSEPGAGFDWAGLVAGAVGALSALRPDAADTGWRAGVDRAIRRD
jgi:hypothetical protein